MLPEIEQLTTALLLFQTILSETEKYTYMRIQAKISHIYRLMVENRILIAHIWNWVMNFGIPATNH